MLDFNAFNKPDHLYNETLKNIFIIALKCFCVVQNI